MWRIVGRLWKVASSLGHINVLSSELESETACREEIQKKRKRALERKKKVDEAVKRTGGPVLTDWEEDDRYADEEFYNKKVVECHQKHSTYRKNLKGST